MTPLDLIGSAANGSARGPRHRDGQPESVLEAFGLTIHIDRHEGTVLEGIGANGKPYRVIQRVPYGYLPGVIGDDGEDFDVYVGPYHDAASVYVATQHKASTGAYDELKGMLGFRTAEEAEACYREHTAPSMFGGIVSLSLDSFTAQIAAWRTSPIGAFCPVVDEEANDMSTNEGQPHGQGDVGASRNAAPEPAGDGGHEPPDGMLVRTAHVRAVRREVRPTPQSPERSVVTVDFVASTEDIDSHDSILLADWAEDGRLSRYLDNPVLLWSHGRGEPVPAIGCCENVRVEGKRLLATAIFDDTTEFDRDVAAKFEKGILRAFSVGFAPGECEVRMIDGCEIVVFAKNELREISAVNVPSNPKGLALRGLYATAREMARAAGGRVEMRDVLARFAADKTLTRGAPVAAPAIPQTTPAHGLGDIMATPTKKTVQTDERAVRATDDGATFDVACPHCEAPVEVRAANMPLPTKRAAEIEETRTALTAERAALTEARALLDSEQKRATALEGKLAEARGSLATLLIDGATREVDARVGKKIEPHERDAEIHLARLFLADAAPDADSPKDAAGNPTRTLGQKRWAERLAAVDMRRDIGLLTAPITTGAPLASPDDKTRAASAGTDKPLTSTRSGEGFAALLDIPATA